MQPVRSFFFPFTLLLATISPVESRWYDPEIGRFISKDPALSGEQFAEESTTSEGSSCGSCSSGGAMGARQLDLLDPQRLNPCVFCMNNPVKYVDADGGCSQIPGYDESELWERTKQTTKSFTSEACEKYRNCPNSTNCLECFQDVIAWINQTGGFGGIVAKAFAEKAVTYCNDNF